MHLHIFLRGDDLLCAPHHEEPPGQPRGCAALHSSCHRSCHDHPCSCILASFRCPSQPCCDNRVYDNKESVHPESRSVRLCSVRGCYSRLRTCVRHIRCKGPI